MKKNLITISISLVLLFLGTSFVRAETLSAAKASNRTMKASLISKEIAETLSSAKALNRTMKASLISKKISELEKKCQSGMIPCENQFYQLIQANNFYMDLCAPVYTYCNGTFMEYMLLQAAAAYESCIGIFAYSPQNIDRSIDREKRIKTQGRQKGSAIV